MARNLINAAITRQRLDALDYADARQLGNPRLQECAAIESAITREYLFNAIDMIVIDRALESNEWQPDDWALNSPAVRGE